MPGNRSLRGSCQAPQFGLRSLFRLTFIIALALWAWQFRDLASEPILLGFAWLPVPMLLAMLAVELFARLIPKVIDLKIWLAGIARSR